MSTLSTRGLLNWKSRTQTSSLSWTLTRGGAGTTLYPPGPCATDEETIRASGRAANNRRRIVIIGTSSDIQPRRHGAHGGRPLHYLNRLSCSVLFSESSVPPWLIPLAFPLEAIEPFLQGGVGRLEPFQLLPQPPELDRGRAVRADGLNGFRRGLLHPAVRVVPGDRLQGRQGHCGRLAQLPQRAYRRRAKARALVFESGGDGINDSLSLLVVRVGGLGEFRQPGDRRGSCLPRLTAFGPGDERVEGRKILAGGQRADRGDADRFSPRRLGEVRRCHGNGIARLRVRIRPEQCRLNFGARIALDQFRLDGRCDPHI